MIVGARSSEGGFSLLELMLAVAMMAIVIVGVAGIVDHQDENARSNVLAMQLKTIGEAANEYIKDNYIAILNDTNANNSKSVISLQQLTDSGHLAAGFNAVNSFGQNVCVVIRRAPNPSNNAQLDNNLLGLVVTEGGDTIDDLVLGQISATVGGAGGGVYAQNPARVTGTLGAWAFDTTNFSGATTTGTNCSGAAGNIALTVGHPTMSLWFADGSSRSASGMLYRNAVNGQPELNTMNTALLTGPNAIVPDDKIGQECNAGRDSSSLGAIATGQDGSVVSCVGNIWMKTDKYWGVVADNIDELGGCDASKAGATRMVKSAVGAAYNAHPYVPYTCDGTGSWKSIAISQDGSLNIGTTLEVNGATQLHNSLHVGGNTKLDAGLEVDNYAVLHNNLHVGGHTTLDGDVSLSGSASGILNLKAFMTFQNQSPASTVETNCNDVGGGKGVTMTTDGDILTCKSGVWKKLGGYNTRTVVYSANQTCGVGAAALAYCPSGYTLTGGGYSLSWWAGNQYTSNAPDASIPRADLNGWYVWGGGKTTDGNGNALACFYSYAVCVK